MILKIKTTYFSINRRGFRKFFKSHTQNYIGKQLKMIKWNRFDTDCKNEWAIFNRWISFSGLSRAYNSLYM